jgi:hypothetical protein
MNVVAAKPSSRWPGVIALIAVVVAAHLWLTSELASQLPDSSSANGASMQRMKAAYVSELRLSTPPSAPAVAAPAPLGRPAKAKRRVKPAKLAASQAQPAASLAEAASEPAVTSSGAEEAALASTSAASEPDATASAPASAASGALANNGANKAGPPFVWPKATRVSYKLEGDFRGPIYGQATVEWVRQGERYQVHVDASVGPSFAPLGSWNLSSAGHITTDGLVPERYENVNRLLIKSSAPKVLNFEAQEVLLPSGQRVARLPGMQDPASQFIQLAYRFMMNPALLKVGNTIEMPLAMIKKVETLAYDVIGEQVLQTPVGAIPTFHVKPRRMIAEGGALPAEIWFAPGLQYLPVRILVRLDEKTFMDMQMERAPQQVPGDAPNSLRTGAN